MLPKDILKTARFFSKEEASAAIVEIVGGKKKKPSSYNPWGQDITWVIDEMNQAAARLHQDAMRQGLQRLANPVAGTLVAQTPYTTSTVPQITHTYIPPGVLV